MEGPIGGPYWGALWKALLEGPMEGPIGGPYWKALLEGPIGGPCEGPYGGHVGATLKDLVKHLEEIGSDGLACKILHLHLLQRWSVGPIGANRAL